MAVLEDDAGSSGGQAAAGRRNAEDRDAHANGVADLRTPRCEELSDIVHGLNNALVSILLNAQVIEWRLPSYSRLKRNIHEVERSAQRGAALVKRLRYRPGPQAAGAYGQPELVSELVSGAGQDSEVSYLKSVVRVGDDESNQAPETSNGRKVPHTIV